MINAAIKNIIDKTINETLKLYLSDINPITAEEGLASSIRLER